jgi:F-box-like
VVRWLQWEFRRRISWVKHDEASLQTIQEKYEQVRNFATPIYCLPVESLTQIFIIDLDGGQSPIGLMLVCRYWDRVVDDVAGIWESLKLETWTGLNRVEPVLQRVNGRMNDRLCIVYNRSWGCMIFASVLNLI